MTAAQELLVDRLVAASAISRRQLRRDREAVMLPLLLRRGGLVTVETTDPARRMAAHLIFVHHGICDLRVTFGAFARGADEFSGWLGSLDRRHGSNAFLTARAAAPRPSPTARCSPPPSARLPLDTRRGASRTRRRCRGASGSHLCGCVIPKRWHPDATQRQPRESFPSRSLHVRQRPP